MVDMKDNCCIVPMIKMFSGVYIFDKKDDIMLNNMLVLTTNEDNSCGVKTDFVIANTDTGMVLYPEIKSDKYILKYERLMFSRTVLK